MGGHGKIKKHGVKQAKYQQKFKANDPEARPVVQAVLKKGKRGMKTQDPRNAPPRADEDVMQDSDLASVRAFVPVYPGPPGIDDRPMSAKERRTEKKRVLAKAQEAKNLPPKKRRKGDDDDADAAAQNKEAKPELPRQKPGESLRDYCARVNMSVKEHLQESRKKMTSERALEKKKAGRVKKRDRTRAKKAKANAKHEGQGKPKSWKEERPDHLDQVERPPILSDQVLKSRQKLKAKLPQKAAETKKKGSEEFTDYAAKVREAYANMKKNRESNSL